LSSALKNLSDYDPATVPSAADMKFAIVVSDWNYEITKVLCDGAYNTLMKHEAQSNNINIYHVPGSFELPMGAQFAAEYTDVDAVICIGCVIQGETKHFDFICQSVAQSLILLSGRFNKPFVFGVLTPNNIEQARERAGGKYGNKGDEAAITAIKMGALKKSFKPKKGGIGFIN
jgi:6,7-dimethyl-8-ribityllumazine synthase